MERKELYCNILENKNVKNYKENELFEEEKIKDFLLYNFDIYVEKIFKNVNVRIPEYNRPVEYDILIFGRTSGGHQRTIGIELKKSGNLTKVVSQAITRKPYVDYQFILVDDEVNWIVDYIIYFLITSDESLKKKFYRIGIINENYKLIKQPRYKKKLYNYKINI